MRDKRKVNVTTVAGSTGVTTVNRLRRAYRKRSPQFQENIFYNLLNHGRVTVDGITYALADWPKNSTV